MPRVCYLHVGMPKTGTTSIQTSFEGTETGATRYADLRAANHSYLLVNLFSARRLDFPSLNDPATTEDDLRQLEIEDRERFEAELARGDRDLVISGEVLFRHFRPEEARALVERVRTRFDTVRVCAYLREPQGYMVSLFQHLLRSGKQHFDAKVLYPRYQMSLSKWDALLGEDAVRVVSYDRVAKASGGILQDFGAWCGLSEARLQSTPVRRNSSYSAEAACTSHVMIEEFGRGSVRDGLIPILRDYGKGCAVPDTDDLARIIDENAEDIAWAEARLGAPFPKPKPVDRAVALPDSEAVYDLVRRDLPAMRQWVMSRPIRRQKSVVARVAQSLRVKLSSPNAAFDRLETLAFEQLDALEARLKAGG